MADAHSHKGVESTLPLSMSALFARENGVERRRESLVSPSLCLCRSMRLEGQRMEVETLKTSMKPLV